MSNLSFLIITYYLDFDLLKRQLDSTAQYLKDYAAYPYVIVLNDDVKYLPELEAILNLYPERKFTVLHKNNYSNKYVDPLWSMEQNTSQSAIKLLGSDGVFESYNAYGWYSQQILKLVAPLEIDSKCKLSEPFDIRSIVNNNVVSMARLNVIWEGDGEIERRIRAAHNLLDAPVTNMIENTTSFGVPYPIKTKYAREIINYLENKNINVNETILKSESITPQTFEFFLYSAWIQKHYQSEINFTYPNLDDIFYGDKSLRRKSV
jgi:hypothetical protein